MAHSSGYASSPSEAEALKLWRVSELARLLKRNTEAGLIEVTQGRILVKLPVIVIPSRVGEPLFGGSFRPCHFPSSQS